MQKPLGSTAVLLFLVLLASAGVLLRADGGAPPAPPAGAAQPAPVADSAQPAPSSGSPQAAPVPAPPSAAPQGDGSASAAKSDAPDPRALAILTKAKAVMKKQPPRFGRSAHYMMMTDSESEPVCQSVLSLAERYRAHFTQYWSGKPELANHAERGWIIIFTDTVSYQLLVDNWKALASPEPLINGIALSADRFSEKQGAYEALRYACFAHLTENLLLDTTNASGSAWLVQGLGSYFALTPGIDTDKPEYGRIQMTPGRREFAYRNMLAQYGGRQTLADLLDDKRVQDFTDAQFLYQASCWSFEHFLMQGDGDAGQKLVTDYVAKVRGGTHGKAAFESVLGAETLSALEDRWRHYVRKSITR